MPDVSVVTTVYNGMPYINNACESILGQTYTDYEWVIVDDGSTDTTSKLLAEIESQHEQVRLYTPGRLGRAKALNYAVKQANGIYIANFDIDDKSHPNRLERQVEYLKIHPDVGLLGTYYVLTNEIRGEKFIRKPPTEHEELVGALGQHIPFAHTMVMYRKKFWEQAGGYPLFDTLIDFGLWIEGAKTDWKYATLPEVLGEHIVHDESYWRSNFEYAREQRALAKLQIKAIKELKLSRWLYFHAAGRIIYPYFPTRLKRIVRRTVGKAGELNV